MNLLLLGRKRGGIFAPSISQQITNAATYDLNFAANVFKGGTIGLTNRNTSNLLIGFLNYTSSYAPNADGSLVYFPGNSLIRRTDLGIWGENRRINELLWNRDLTNSAWVASGITAVKDQVGIGPNSSQALVANSASRITATADGGTLVQSVAATSASRMLSAYVKRLSGSGSVQMTLDGGASWMPLALTSGWKRFAIGPIALANPQVGFRIDTAGDSVAVDLVQCEAATSISTPIATTSASVTRFEDRISTQDTISNPLFAALNAPFGFYYQWMSWLKSSGTVGLMLTAGGVQVEMIGGKLRFGGRESTNSANVGTAGGFGEVNKFVGYYTADGVLKTCLNGGPVNSFTGFSIPVMTHADLITNGSGGANLWGALQRAAFFAPESVPDDKLQLWSA